MAITIKQFYGLIFGSACLITGCAEIQTLKPAVINVGQLFCAQMTDNGPLIVKLVDLAGAPVIATDAGSFAVEAACAAINATPVSPPINARFVPTMAANVHLGPTNKLE